ncbi:unnamed protein product [Malus baccata var. baccata]
MGESSVIYYLTIESDCLHIVAGMQCSSYNESRVGHIVEDAKATLSSIAGATIIRVRRQANGATHRLTHIIAGSTTALKRVAFWSFTNTKHRLQWSLS